MDLLTILWNLCFSFARIGIAAFGGGISTLPLIEHELVIKTGWITLEEFNRIVALAQVTPGPIAINAATFVGYQKAGVLGSITATLSLITAPLLLLTTLLIILKNCKEKTAAEFKMSMRPIVAALLTLALFPPLLATWQHGFRTVAFFFIGVFLITKVRFFRQYPFMMFILLGILGILFLH